MTIRIGTNEPGGTFNVQGHALAVMWRGEEAVHGGEVSFVDF